MTYIIKDLHKELKSELSGDFERIMLALVTPPAEYLAEEIHDAVCGIGTNERRLVDILCTATNAELRAIRDAYSRICKKGIEADIKGDTSGAFKAIMIAILQVNLC